MVVQTRLVAASSEPSAVVQNVLTPQAAAAGTVVYNSNATPTSGLHALVNAGNGAILTGEKDRGQKSASQPQNVYLMANT